MLDALTDARVLGPSFAALLTGAALLLQSWLQRRDQASVRKQERVADQTQRDLERKQAIADHWRNARHEAHVQVLATSGALMVRLTRQRGDVQSATDANPVDLRQVSRDRRPTMLSLRHALADARLVGSPQTAEAISELESSLLALKSHTDIITAFPPLHREAPATKADKLKEWIRLYDQATRATADYRSAVRGELGTAAAD